MLKQRKDLTYEEVHAVIQMIEKNGNNATIEAIKEIVGGGSKTTIVRYRKKYDIEKNSIMNGQSILSLNNEFAVSIDKFTHKIIENEKKHCELIQVRNAELINIIENIENEKSDLQEKLEMCAKNFSHEIRSLKNKLVINTSKRSDAEKEKRSFEEQLNNARCELAGMTVKLEAVREELSEKKIKLDLREKQISLVQEEMKKMGERLAENEKKLAIKEFENDNLNNQMKEVNLMLENYKNKIVKI